jgi:hypothetical protein
MKKKKKKKIQINTLVESLTIPENVIDANIIDKIKLKQHNNPRCVKKLNSNEENT